MRLPARARSLRNVYCVIYLYIFVTWLEAHVAIATIAIYEKHGTEHKKEVNKNWIEKWVYATFYWLP